MKCLEEALTEARNSPLGFYRYLKQWKHPLFEYLDDGSSRWVFRHKGKGYVIKVEKFGDGYFNKREYQVYRKHKGNAPLARCRLMKDSRFLVMEKVDNANMMYAPLKNSPFYTGDGRQGGLRNGRAVFYDYASVDI